MTRKYRFVKIHDHIGKCVNSTKYIYKDYRKDAYRLQRKYVTVTF